MLYMFQAGPPPNIRSSKLYTQHWVLAGSNSSMTATGSSKAWQVPDAVYTVLSSWWWTEELPETCGAFHRNKYVVYCCILLLILENIITMYGSMNVKPMLLYLFLSCCCIPFPTVFHNLSSNFNSYFWIWWQLSLVFSITYEHCPVFFHVVIFTMVSRSLSPRHGLSSYCEWRR
jgi:hypothetical protein